MDYKVEERDATENADMLFRRFGQGWWYQEHTLPARIGGLRAKTRQVGGAPDYQ